MSKIQKNTSGEVTKKTSENGKIHVDGQVGLGLNIDFPGSAEVDGGAKFSLKLPTWLAFDLIKWIGDRFNSHQSN